MLCYIIAMNAAHHHHDAPSKLSRNIGHLHPPTVYRALNELMQLGMVHRLQTDAAFIACGHGACDGKFAFAICRDCQKVVEIPLSDAHETALLALAPEEIKAEQVTLELAGLRQHCRPRAAI
jgi:Fur family zinc uptake transcriptional regulator